MLPAERLFQSQNILISKLAGYLHLVNMEDVSIHDEDIDKLSFQIESGKIIIKEINSLFRVVSSLLNDIKENELFTESVKDRYEKNRDECITLINRIEKAASENSENLKSLKNGYKKRIESIEKTVTKEMKMLHSSGFSDRPEFLDIEA